MLSGIVIVLLAVVPFRWLPPPTTAFMLRDAQLPEKFILHDWMPIEKMSAELAIAVVSAEDQKFPDHHGFDLAAIRAALEEDRARPRGASTISQQLAKNLYLWPSRSLLRKAIEAALTVLIELTWPKRRILEVYLNVVEFGPGIYGAPRASREFFGKTAGELTRREAALMAAVLPNPGKLSLRRPTRYLKRRAQQIERGIRNLGGAGYLPWLRPYDASSRRRETLQDRRPLFARVAMQRAMKSSE